MQKLILILVFQFIVCFVFAQNVGIGTTSPEHVLDVRPGGGKLKTYPMGLEFTVNTTGGWARGFRFRNENSSADSLATTVYGSLNGTAYISTGFDLNVNQTGYTSRRLVILKNGFVGIGTTNPAQNLHVQGDARVDGRSVYLGPSQRIYGDASSALHFYGNHSNVTQLVLRDKEDDIYGRLYGSGDGARFGLLDGDANWSYKAEKDLHTSFLINNSEKMRILANGNVGIGTTAPEGKLDVRLGAGKLKTFSTGLEYTVSTSGGWARGFRLRNEMDSTQTTIFGSLSGTAYIATGYDMTASATGYQNRKMVILPNGNVGIGSNNPNSKLAVNGNIRSREVLVETSNWPDYVFQEDYKLPTLQEEAAFIKQNGHLSGFQSESEMENTITVGDVTKRQQEKIEQMMLHLIEIKNEMNAYRQKTDKEITELKAENESLKAAINKSNQ